MTLDNALRLRSAIKPLLLAAETGSDLCVTARLALTLVEGELLSLGWRNEPGDIPAMDAADLWVAEQIA